MYQALYRKWRPKTFSDVIGQSHITETLRRQVAEDRTSHAYLFTGTRGTGKTTCAKILAKAVNCENPVNGNPCNRCASCLGIDDGSVMDVVEMDAASNNGVDSVRALRDEAIFSPAGAKKRVYIIDEVHMLSTSAFNALLKILEEPPEHLMFILATTELHKVLPTILSRCQRHSFKRLDSRSIENRLMYVAGQEGLSLSPEAAGLIAGLAEGGMRDALSMLDQCSGREKIDTDTVYSAMGLAGSRHVCAMLNHILKEDTASAIELFTELWQGGKDPATLMGELSSLLREILMRAVAPKGGKELISGCYDEKSLAYFAGKFSKAQLVNKLSIIQTALSDMRAGQARIICELCLITLCESALGEDLPLIRERIAKIERSIEDLASRPVTVAQPMPQMALKTEEPIYEPVYEAEDAPPFDVDEPAPPAPVIYDEPPFDMDEDEDEYIPDDRDAPPEDFDIYSQLPRIPELPPLPGDSADDDGEDARSALMSFSSQVPERVSVKPEPVDELDIPSFMVEEEEERPRKEREIKRKIYFDEEATPASEREVFKAEAPAAPIAAAAPPAAPKLSGEAIWEKTKADLSGNMPFGLYLLLTDPTQVEATIYGDELLLTVKSSFAMNMLNRPDIVSKVGTTAGGIAGKALSARMVEPGAVPAAPASSAPAAGMPDKLDELGKFEVVSFK